jgi:large subunit ribosomal protein L17
MRHLKSGRKLGRTSAHRKALFRNMVTALIRSERIRTTLAKAKELRSHVEKTITLGKKGTLHARRRALRVVNDKEAFLKLFGPLSERYAERPGGYTRIIRVGNRRGDDAPMALIELVDREEEAPAPPSKEKKETKGKAKKDAAKAADKKKATEEKKSAKKKAAPKKEEDKKPAKAEANEKTATKKKAAEKSS